MKRIGFVCLLVAVWLQNCPESRVSADEVDLCVQHLTNVGLSIAGQNVKLSPAWLADGMDAAKQQAVTDKLAGRRKRQFYNDSIAATVESDIRSIKVDKRRAGYIVDFAFIVYADLDHLMPSENQPSNGGLQALAKESDMKVTELTPSLLKSAGITLSGLGKEKPNDADGDSRSVHGTFSLLDKVFISSVVQSAIKQTDESITVAWEQDTRFHETPVYSNRWKFIDNDDDGGVHVYNGFAGYAKVTKLKAKDGALLVEYHYAFAEPKEWSEERISLRAKLSIVLQESVRKARRQIKKLKEQAAAKQ